MSDNQSKLFTVQPEFHYGIYTGKSSDDLQMMVTPGLGKVFVVIYFNKLGVLLRYDEIAPITVNYERTNSPPENQKSYEASLIHELHKIGLHTVVEIHVQRFLIPEHAIGLRQYPNSLQRFLKANIEYTPEEIADLQKAKAHLKATYPNSVYLGFSKDDLSGYTAQQDDEDLEFFERWTDSGDFVLWLQNDFWCDSNGYIHSS
jgi:hypothetical protein